MNLDVKLELTVSDPVNPFLNRFYLNKHPSVTMFLW